VAPYNQQLTIKIRVSLGKAKGFAPKDAGTFSIEGKKHFPGVKAGTAKAPHEVVKSLAANAGPQAKEEWE